jgi:hypothetical protein
VDSKRQLARQVIISSEGREDYEKLLLSLARYAESNDTRLRYWQEAIFRRLESETGMSVLTFDQATQLLLVCHVHCLPIVWAEGRKASGAQPEHSPDYLAAESDQFPHSREVVWVPGHVPGSRVIRVLSCPGCVEARRQWAGQLPNNSFKPKPLRGSA